MREAHDSIKPGVQRVPMYRDEQTPGSRVQDIRARGAGDRSFGPTSAARFAGSLIQTPRVPSPRRLTPVKTFGCALIAGYEDLFSELDRKAIRVGFHQSGGILPIDDPVP